MDATVTRYTSERRPERSRTKFRQAVSQAKSKSAVTNGRRLHAEARADTVWSRRFRDVFAEITYDLGGPDLLSEAQRQLIRRCATLSVECEKLEGHAVLGEPFDLDQYGMMTDRLGRTFQRLGLKRVARNVTPDLRQYLLQKKTATVTTTMMGRRTNAPSQFNRCAIPVDPRSSEVRPPRLEIIVLDPRS